KYRISRLSSRCGENTHPDAWLQQTGCAQSKNPLSSDRLSFRRTSQGHAAAA
ncbi:hypothetical protein NDU88_004931, partial [Pleurodeles waltl]